MKLSMEKSNLKVALYNEASSKNFDTHEIAKYVKELIPSVLIDFRNQFFESDDNLALEMARIKVRNITSIGSYKPLLGEIEYEKKILKCPDKASAAVIYDGESLQQIARKSIPQQERNIDYLHIIFTKRLFASFDANDRRYHARVAVFGFPNIISFTGVVEAPAKPKKYYALRNKFLNLGTIVADEKIREIFRGQFIDYEDERMIQVIQGYTLQAMFYHLFDEAFCSDKSCRLFNGHWQEEVINAQIKSGRLCDYHNEMLERFNNEN